MSRSYKKHPYTFPKDEPSRHTSPALLRTQGAQNSEHREGTNKGIQEIPGATKGVPGFFNQMTHWRNIMAKKKYYIVTINEYATKQVAVEAEDEDQAEALATELYENGIIDLSTSGSADIDVEDSFETEDEAIMSADDGKVYRG